MQTSPVNGESGVSVGRETIFRFNFALATNTFLGNNHVYAEAGGRRILSRLELSSDRRAVTLFYLEPLPGSTRVQATFDAFGLMDQFGRLADLDGDGVAGGAARVEFDTLSLTPLPGTAVTGNVFASEQVPGTNVTNFINRPLAGVTITVDGMEQSLRTVTDSNGFFRLSPCPVGDFFVHIDGRTVTNLASGIRYPDQAYYPFVGKAWKATAGNTNNLAGGTGLIYLPLVAAGTLQPVSATEDTMITFPPSVIAANPALAGAHLVVPANSLYSDNGTRGGRVGIAPVPADRLPGPLPPGLEFPLVFTVQTDGPLNFDRPVPVCLPNLPDPVLGTRLPPGSKQALVTFSHDKGIWEAVGTMTVSADGAMVCTDPGGGVLSPGGGGVAPVPHKPDLQPHEPRCKKDPDAHQRCRRRCHSESRACLARCNRQSLDCIRRGFGETCFKELGDCLESCLTHQSQCNSDCARLYLCDDSGFSPSGQRLPAIANGNALPLNNDTEELVLQSITDMLRQVGGISYVYRVSGQPIPEEVQAEINSLVEQANMVAGGDAAGFLEEYGRKMELDVAQSQTEFGGFRGNEPRYPLRYVFALERPTESLLLRGITGYFGEYSIWVPRDAQIRFGVLYDERLNQFDLFVPDESLIQRNLLPRATLGEPPANHQDTDRDGTSDLAEFVYGTAPFDPDSDHDGIPDGAEVAAGTDPLDGRPAITGVIATTDTPGRATDVIASDGLAVVADSAAGVAVFDIARGNTLLRLSQVDTPGTAQAVARSGRWVVVADGLAGMAVIDVSTPANARIVHQIALPGDTRAVVACGSMAFAGSTATGTGEQVTQIDLETGTIVRTLRLSGFTLQDLALRGEYLYVLQTGQDGHFQTLRTIPILDGQMSLHVHTLNAPGANYTGDRLRLSVAGDVLVSAHAEGYTSFDLANPAQPTLRRYSGSNGDLTALWQLVPSGGQPTLFVGGRPGEKNLKLADMGDWTGPGVFLTQFTTSGRVNAACLYQDRVYLANDVDGLLVVNYRQPPLAQPGDSGPTFTVRASFPLSPATVEASQSVQVMVDAASGVQLREVEFSVNGVLVARDGGFPFETCFTTPSAGTLPAQQFPIVVKATDTGGRSRTETIAVTLVPDRTPPRVVTVEPFGGGKTVTRVAARFNGALDPATLNAASYQLTAAGLDGRFDTADDAAVSGGDVRYDPLLNAAVMEFSSSIPAGLYRAKLRTSIADPAGNPLASEFRWSFAVADAVFWVNPFGGEWNEPSNWSSGVVPGPEDNVVILATGSALGAEEFEALKVTLGPGVVAVRDLLLFERLQIVDNATLKIAGRFTFHDQVTIAAGTILGGTLITEGAGQLNIQSAILDGVTLHGDLDLGPLGDQSTPFVEVVNGLTCTGTIRLNGGYLVFGGSQVFDGTEVRFGPRTGSFLLRPATTLTLPPGLILRGNAGYIGFGYGSGPHQLINRGLISADEAGGTLALDGDALRNEGVVRAAAGRIQLQNTIRTADLGRLENTGGQLLLNGTLDNAGANLVLDGTTGPLTVGQGTVRGGTVTLNGSGRLLLQSATLDGVTLHGDLDLGALGDQSTPFVEVVNGLTCTGTIRLNGGYLVFGGSQVFDGTEVRFGPRTGNFLLRPATTLTLGPGTILRGNAGYIGFGYGSGPHQLINRGLISADEAGGTLALDGDALRNEGVVRAAAGRIQLQNTIRTADLGRFENTGGQLLLDGTLDNAGANLVLDGTTGPLTLGQGTLRGGTVTLNGSGRLVPQSATLDGVTLHGDLDLVALAGQSPPFFQVENGLTSTGTIRLDGGYLVFKGSQTFDGANVRFGPQSGQLQMFPGTTLTIGAGSTLRGRIGFIGGVYGSGPHQLINRGLISADEANGTLTISAGDFVNDVGGVLEATASGAVLRVASSQFVDLGIRRQSGGGQVVVGP